jgi:hypothetical protein
MRDSRAVLNLLEVRMGETVDRYRESKKRLDKTQARAKKKS